jgi:hypothetical protein
MTDPTIVRAETKIAVILRADLPVWQKLNVTAFLVSGIAQRDPDVVGKPYVDADATEYLPMFGQPVLAFAATSEELARTLDRAVSRGVVPSVFIEAMFVTGHDAANRATVAARARTDLDLVGIGLRADRRDVDKIVKGLRLHS